MRRKEKIKLPEETLEEKIRKEEERMENSRREAEKAPDGKLPEEAEETAKSRFGTKNNIVEKLREKIEERSETRWERKKEQEQKPRIIRYLLLLILAAVIFYLQVTGHLFSFNLYEETVVNTDNVILGVTDEGDILSKQGYQLVASDPNGEQLWQYEFDTDKFQVMTKENYILLYDLENRYIKLLDNSGKLMWQNRFSRELNFVKLLEDGNSVLCLREGNIQSLAVYDKNGSTSRKEFTADYPNIISADYQKNNASLLVQMMDEKEIIENKLNYIKDNNLQWTVSEEDLYLMAKITSGNYILAVTDNVVTCYGVKGEEVWRQELEDSIVNMDLSRENLALLTEESGDSLIGGRKNKVIFMDLSGNVTFETTVKKDPQLFVINENSDGVLLKYDREIQNVTKNGTEFNIKLKSGITISLSGNRRYIVAKESGKATLYTLDKEKK